jgi:ADP-heptose:LPS heptosyltransferase
VKRFLLVRTDRIGDLVLVTPAINILRRNYGDAHIAVLVSEYTAPLLENHPGVNEIIVEKPFFRMVSELREKKFDAAIHFFVTRNTAVATALAGIPERIGPASKIWSMFFTRRIAQHRSQILRHEADFNLDLLDHFDLDRTDAKTSLFVTDAEFDFAKKYLAEKHGVADKDILVIMHPGSRGSARNWPFKNYARLADRILATMPGVKLLLTGTQQEQPLLRQVEKSMMMKPLVLGEGVPLRMLMALIIRSRAVITNSTGPLHIAVALGVPTVSFFPKLKGCMPERWGPYGEGHIVIQPEGQDCDYCTGASCKRYDCMDSIDTEKVLAAVQKQVGELPKPEKYADITPW